MGNTLLKVAEFSADNMQNLEPFEKGAFGKLEQYLNTKTEGSCCIVSSVIDYPDSLARLLETRFKTIFLTPETPLPVKIGYKTPETLGKDRIAAAVAAWGIFPGNDLLVIDAGTAITMDLVTKEGVFAGGAIAPGIDMRFAALHTFTGKLPLIKKAEISFLTGTTTHDSILSGVINGVAREIDGIIDEYKLNYHKIVVVLGGGDSFFLLKRLKNSIFALPNPVLSGLNIILDYNIESKKNH